MTEKKLMLEITISPPIGSKSEFFDSWDEVDEFGAKRHVVCFQNFDKDTIPGIEFCFYTHEGDLSLLTHDSRSQEYTEKR